MSCIRSWGTVLLALLVCTSALAGSDGNAPIVLPPTGGDAATAKLLRARHELALHEAAARRLRPPTTSTTPGWVLLAGGNGLSLTANLHDLRFDFTTPQVTAVGKLQIKNNSITPVNQVYLYLERFSSAALNVSDASGPLSFSDLGNNMVWVALSSAIAAEQSVELTVSQTGMPTCKAGMIGVVPCQVSSGLTCVVGSTWTPLLLDENTGELIDAGLDTLKVTVPAAMKAAAAGLDGGITTNADGTTTTTFQLLRGPYFGAAPFLTGSTPFGSSQVRSFVLAANSGVADGWRQAAVDILTFHGQRYGAYDLPKLDIVEAHPNSGAAFGPLSAVFIPPQSLALPPLDWSSRMTIAHELGHQWFAGFIQIGDTLSPWLNEGFATFTEMEYTIARGSDAYKVDYGPTYRQFNNLIYVYTVIDGKDVPLTGDANIQAPSEVYVAVTYNKGGMLVSMIRYLLGDTAFLQAMSQYRKDHVTAKATPASLAASVKTATGTDISPLITAFTKPAYPTFTVEVLRSTQASQFITKVNATSDMVPYLPVQVDLALADGTTQHQQLAFGSTASQSATYTTDSEVIQLRFDPACQVVGRHRGGLAGDLVLDGDVDGVDLVELDWAMGRKYDSSDPAGLFPTWADLVFDGVIDQKDADQLIGSFGKRAGE